ncbi:hypothetical protein TNCV_4579911 [Trichonephila clavipes]|nr:hypothetical protein TNCV_4579911 [Trichonephila clavipes]
MVFVLRVLAAANVVDFFGQTLVALTKDPNSHTGPACQILFLTIMAVVHCSFDINPYYIYDDSGLGYGGYGLGLRDYGYPAYGHRDIIYDGYGYSRLGYGRYF